MSDIVEKIEKIDWEEEVKKDYKIDDIVPISVAMNHAEALNRDEISYAHLRCVCDRFKEKKGNFSNRLSYKSIGAMFYGAYRIKFPNKKAFGDWTFARTEEQSRTRGAVYAWNLKTKQRIWLTSFEFYVIVREYQIAALKAMNLNIDGSSNPVPFNGPIDYSDFR